MEARFCVSWETTYPALNDADPARRREALVSLLREEPATPAPAGSAPGAPPAVNLHLHTFYSFNALNDSPTHIAWRAHRHGLFAAGIVDFDVLDGLEEFLDAGALLNLRTCAGIETRVFVPEFADAVINSPGEPGIAYHLGVGLPRRTLGTAEERFLAHLRETAARRNRELVDRVNRGLAPVAIDYDRDVLPLTPNGNATERHLCRTYALKAAAQFPDPAALASFWSEKLGAAVAPADVPCSNALLDRIRARTMKRGGFAYVPPETRTFPSLADMNAFILRAGGIPTLGWLDGQSDGEERIEAWLETAMATGTAALNLIPDRNFTPGVKDRKLANLQRVIALAERLDLPVLVGTEMNAPGQKFVDNFTSAELAPHVPLFTRSACIVYAHTILQRHLDQGYLSPWARAHFPSRRRRNAFFEEVGRTVPPNQLHRLPEIVRTLM